MRYFGGRVYQVVHFHEVQVIFQIRLYEIHALSGPFNSFLIYLFTVISDSSRVDTSFAQVFSISSLGLQF